MVCIAVYCFIVILFNTLNVALGCKCQKRRPVNHHREGAIIANAHDRHPIPSCPSLDTLMDLAHAASCMAASTMIMQGMPKSTSMIDGGKYLGSEYIVIGPACLLWSLTLVF